MTDSNDAGRPEPDTSEGGRQGDNKVFPQPDAWLVIREIYKDGSKEEVSETRTNLVSGEFSKQEAKARYENRLNRCADVIAVSELWSGETIRQQSIDAWECNICGYISTDKVEVTECCDADALYIDIVKTEVFSGDE